jgi:hypothetical protein
VGLTTLTDAGFSEKQMHLLLNLVEMWMCNVFQTLPRTSLEKYAPLGSRIAWAGQHLNVALPLWQSFRDNEDSKLWEEQAMGVSKEGFRDFLFSADPPIRAWLESIERLVPCNKNFTRPRARRKQPVCVPSGGMAT